MKAVREYDVVLEASRVADAYALVSFNGVRYSVPAEYARKAIRLQCRLEHLTFVIDGAVVAQHRYPAYEVRLVQNHQHLPPLPSPRHEQFARLGEAIVDRLGEVGRRYVEAIELKAPHAPLALLREVLERHDEYVAIIVTGSIESLLQFAVVKRGTLTPLCHRFGGTPRVALPMMTSPLPHVDVEQRSLASYDVAAAWATC